MAISTDELNGSFRRLKGPAIEGFLKSLPLWKAILDKSGDTDDGGTYWERVHIGTSPVQGRGLFNGDEILPMVTSNVTSQLKVQPHAISAAVNIPRTVMQRQNGKNGVVRLIDTYPKAVLTGAARDLHKYLLTGISAGFVFPTAELAGYLSLNGQYAAGVGVGVTNGLLDFSTPATQTDTVQNVAKSFANSYYNQYQDCTTATLWEQMQNLYADCAEFAEQVNGGPDLIIQDPDTYLKFQAEKRDIVRLKAETDSTGKTDYLASPFGVGMVHRTSDLNRALFAGVAADGVTYMLNTDHFSIEWIEKPTMSDFQDKIADQRVVTAVFDANYVLGCEKLTAQGVLSGGAV